MKLNLFCICTKHPSKLPGCRMCIFFTRNCNLQWINTVALTVCPQEENNSWSYVWFPVLSAVLKLIWTWPWVGRENWCHNLKSWKGVLICFKNRRQSHKASLTCFFLTGSLFYFFFFFFCKDWTLNVRKNHLKRVIYLLGGILPHSIEVWYCAVMQLFNFSKMLHFFFSPLPKQASIRPFPLKFFFLIGG